MSADITTLYSRPRLAPLASTKLHWAIFDRVADGPLRSGIVHFLSTLLVNLGETQGLRWLGVSYTTHWCGESASRLFCQISVL